MLLERLEGTAIVGIACEDLLLRVETFGQGSLEVGGTGFGRFTDCLSTGAAARLIHDFA